MSEPSQPVQWENKFAWLRIFRAFRIALELKKILLGTAAILLLCAGDLALERFHPVEETPNPSKPILKMENIPLPSESGEKKSFQFEISEEVPVTETPEKNTPLSLLTKPLKTFIEPLEIIILKQKNWTLTAYAWTKLLYSIFVWSIFGLAICRISAIQFARQEKISLRASLNFSFQKFLSAVSAPIIPLCGIGLFWFLGTIGGWIGLIPGFGEMLLGISWFLLLLFGLATTIILVGLCLGWPLMIPAIATEGSDGFDGFSRAYSYLFSRPWNYVWYVFVTILYGAVTIALFYIFANAFTLISTRMVSSGMNLDTSGQAETISTLIMQSWNTDTIRLPFEGDSLTSLGRNFANYWVIALKWLCEGFAISFFWTGATIVYFLIRRADDATDFSEVYHPKEELQDDLLPLVGIADSDQPTVEQPVTGIKTPEPPNEVEPKEEKQADEDQEKDKD